MNYIDKNTNLKNHLEIASETVRQTIFSFIPAGPILEIFWSYRNNLKQKRVLDFSESIKTALEKIGEKELDSSNIQTEDFVDLMELVYVKVMSTRSAYKLERFRNILVNQIIQPNVETLLFKKYVNLLDQLEDVQILILSDFKYWLGTPIRSIVIAYAGEIALTYSDTQVIERISDSVGTDVTKAELEYYTNELVTLGLIRNNTKVITQMGSSSPQNDYQISPVGISFLEFITLSD
ncbi:hypothetical protein G5B10_11720 [Fluviicola sp. SGL-29]|nr:hypothetical protein [Fluviicola sp. SGL-29]